MYEKIMALSPVGIDFELYQSSKTAIKFAPSFWSSHRHYIEGSYGYDVKKLSYDEIAFGLQSLCAKNKIVFEKVKIRLEEYIQKLLDAVKMSRDYISFEVRVLYEELEESYCDRACIRQNARCKSLARDRPNVGCVSIYFDSTELNEAIEEYNDFNCVVEPASMTSVQIETIKPNNFKEEKSMTGNNNNLYNPINPVAQTQQQTKVNPFANIAGIDLKFGPVDDPRIKSTMLGVVFQGDNDRWYKFDKENGVRTDITGLENFVELPLTLFPATEKDVKKGDLILYEDEYYYVKKKKEGSFKLVSASTGKEEKIYPATNIMNMNFFTKVFVLMEGGSLMDSDGHDLSDNFKMAMMLSMYGGNGQMNNMLPMLMMLKGGDTPFAGLFDQVSSGSGMESILPLLCLSQGFGQQPNGDGMNPLAMMLVMNKFMNGGKKKSPKKKAANKKAANKKVAKEGSDASPKDAGEKGKDEPDAGSDFVNEE